MMQQSQENSMVNSIKSREKVKSKKKKGSRSGEQVVDDIELIILVSSKRFIGVNTEKDSVVWNNYDAARWRAVRDSAHEKVFSLLSDPVPEPAKKARFNPFAYLRDGCSSSTTEVSTAEPSSYEELARYKAVNFPANHTSLLAYPYWQYNCKDFIFLSKVARRVCLPVQYNLKEISVQLVAQSQMLDQVCMHEKLRNWN
ncbi:hypothetical protein HELRODRAFT_166857 [Helobdella robusta]|uniref:Uncharacterized protein n=1 Tax=Helobdella robusta TaxID=6412 RepID=T1EYN1_HELRO|nr:hypothetical protein HELRODRAFT_166857 [Helobdella robusta]ESO11809.1 hypothetical protein HELRODRAFT_166857 [Helobdella robusta]